MLKQYRAQRSLAMCVCPSRAGKAVGTLRYNAIEMHLSLRLPVRVLLAVAWPHAGPVRPNDTGARALRCGKP